MLNRGDIGADVAEWQTFLRTRRYCGSGGALLVVNADFDDDTEHATRRFQQDNGLSPTGILCLQTEAVARKLGWRT